MKKLLVMFCLLAFTGAAYAEANYIRTTSPLSVGDTDKYYKDLNSWDSRNLYVPGQPYNQPYDYSYGNVNVPGQTTATQPQQQRATFTTTNGAPQSQNVANTSTQATQQKRRGTGYRWGKTPGENHYNFGGTGFKSKGFGQGYTN